MSINTFRRQGDPVQAGWSIGRAPLALRGIRFADGEGGAPPAAPPSAPPAGGQPPAGDPNSAAPNPAQLAAFYAGQSGGQTPPAAPTPPAPPVQQVQGFTPEQVQKLMTESEAAQQAAKEAQDALAKAQQERDEFQAQVTQFAREKAVTTAAADKANAALLLDSASFQAAIKDVDLNDPAALTTAVDAFVNANPAYAAAPNLPGTSGGTPSGGTTDTPKTLEGAIAARLAS
ncbi:MAG: hypothetical protein WDA07_14200 [Leucobacter sp.]